MTHDALTYVQGKLGLKPWSSRYGWWRRWQTECIGCGEEAKPGECASSKRGCGHHCNHAWSHDECCWCGSVFGSVS